ncbi:hypothetical protein Vafri_5685, partial [Volvox africanus]
MKEQQVRVAGGCVAGGGGRLRQTEGRQAGQKGAKLRHCCVVGGIRAKEIEAQDGQACGGRGGSGGGTSAMIGLHNLCFGMEAASEGLTPTAIHKSDKFISPLRFSLSLLSQLSKPPISRPVHKPVCWRWHSPPTS